MSNNKSNLHSGTGPEYISGCRQAQSLCNVACPVSKILVAHEAIVTSALAPWNSIHSSNLRCEHNSTGSVVNESANELCRTCAEDERGSVILN